MPFSEINWLAVAVAVIVSFIIGSAYYGVAVREVWQRSMGFTGERAPGTVEAIRGSVINIVGTIFMAYVLARLIADWRPAGGETQSAILTGIIIGLLAWIGFVVPTLATGVAYERKSWTVFGINAFFQLVSLLVMGLILALWR